MSNILVACLWLLLRCHDEGLENALKNVCAELVINFNLKIYPPYFDLLHHIWQLLQSDLLYPYTLDYLYMNGVLPRSVEVTFVISTNIYRHF